MNSDYVIAVTFGENYVACVCHCDDEIRLQQLLKSFASTELACGLAYSGDFTVTEDGSYSSFYRDFGFAWLECCPAVLENADKLVEYCESVNIPDAYIFEQGHWQNKWLPGQHLDHRLTA